MDRGAIFDVDRTLYTGEKGFIILDGIEALARCGLCRRDRADAVMELDRRFAGLLGTGKYPYPAFADDLMAATARALEGVRKGDVREVLEAYMRTPGLAYVFSRDLVSMVRERGYTTVAISGSPIDMITPFTGSLGIEEAIGTSFALEGDVYTGEVTENCGLHETKLRHAQEWIESKGIDAAACAGFGDSDADGFMDLVGHPVAIHPNPALEEKARRNGWLVCNDDGTLLDDVAAYLPAYEAPCDAHVRSS